MYCLRVVTLTLIEFSVVDWGVMGYENGEEIGPLQGLDGNLKSE
jgi:hypothetical protein